MSLNSISPSMKFATSLQPLVVVYFPRFSDAVRDVLEIIVPRYPGCRAIARSGSNVETSRYAALWDHEHRCALLVVREALDSDAKCTRAIQIALQSAPERPGALLIIEPDSRYHEKSDRLAWQMTAAIADLQVIEYDPSWKQSPPRIR